VGRGLYLRLFHGKLVRNFEFANFNALDLSRTRFSHVSRRLYEPHVLQKISSHFETKQPLSPEIIDDIIKIRSHLAGYKLCKELYLSQLDLQLHSR